MIWRGFKWSVHRVVVACMGLLVVGSVVVWYATLDTLPRKVRLVTGEEGGLYYRVGSALAERLHRRTGREAMAVPTHGSVDNVASLRAGEAEVAILQGGAAPAAGLAVIAPLYTDVLHVIVREDSGVQVLGDLAGKRVVLGPAGSGMRSSALVLLDHYGLTTAVVDVGDRYFLELLTDAGLDAAVVTTGIMNPDLTRLLRTGRFRLLEIPDAAALERKDYFLKATVLPRGLYAEDPRIPAGDVTTLSTMAYLVVREDATKRLVTAILMSLYEGDLAQSFPMLVPYSEALARTPVPLHPAARLYFSPPDQIGFLANVMEAIAAFKELTVALAAGAYLLWDRWRLRREQEVAEARRAQKEALDVFLEQTLRIEEAQISCDDPQSLKAFLDDLTRIKLQALHKLTDESLRGDRAFTIFIMQCANLSSKLQLKLLRGSRVGDPSKPGWVEGARGG